ncbi:MAG: prenyltransferase/squalene oxidase repeat-containing protein, partial [Candidatus Bathyarchaeia archaeon]
MMNQNIGVLEEELRKRTADYILARRNEDGGYTSVQFTDSNARDTFMALATLKELEVKPPYIEKTIEWLKGLPLTNLCSIYYVNKSLWILGQPLVDVVEILDDLRNEDGGYGTLEIDVESTSELDTTLMSVELLKMLNKCFDQEKTKSFVLRLKNHDGGFGKNGESNLISTYHALKILNLLSYEMEDGKLD